MPTVLHVIRFLKYLFLRNPINHELGAFVNDFPCVEIAPISQDEHEQTAHLATSTVPTPQSHNRFAEVGSVVM